MSTAVEIKKRTQIDFSKHQLEINQKGKDTVVYKFRKPGTALHGITFINSNGIMAVTGDFGNWIFCREFKLSIKRSSTVSDSYWSQKLKISSTQNPEVFDPVATDKELNKLSGEYSTLSYDQQEELYEYIDLLKGNLNSQFHYESEAFSEKPSFLYYEQIPECYKQHPWLSMVYDAYDQMVVRFMEGAYTEL